MRCERNGVKQAKLSSKNCGIQWLSKGIATAGGKKTQVVQLSNIFF